MRNFTRWALRIAAGAVVICLLILVAFRVSAAWRERGPVAPPAQGQMVRTDNGAIFVQMRGPETGVPYLLFPDRAAMSADPRNYAGVRMPTALIRGRQDSVTPLTQGQRLNGLIAGSSLDIIDGAGHIPHIETPEQLTPILADRLKALVLIRGR